MSITSAIAIYFIIWWTTLFAVLPFGVRNAHEAGKPVAEGHDAGAPADHGLTWKAWVTTIIATAIFVPVYLYLSQGGLESLSRLMAAPEI
jgi:predicted secreted protein